jgi:hypothetical protein
MSFQCPPQFNISRSEGLRCTVTFVNTGTQSHAFDVVVQIGTGDPSAGTYQAILQNYVNDVASAPGQSVSVNVDFPNISYLSGTYTIVIYLVDWDPSTGNVQQLYDGKWCLNVLVVS